MAVLVPKEIMPIIISSSIFTIIAAGLVSLGLLFRIRRNHLLPSKPFFWHWTIGFAILSLIHAPVFLINLKVIPSVGYSMLMIFYNISFFAMLIGYLLLFRGTVWLLTSKKFWLNALPVLIFLYVTGLTLATFFILQFEVSVIFSMLTFALIAPMNLYLALIFFYFYQRGCSVDTTKKRTPALVMSLAWLYIFVLDIVIWYALVTFHPDFWILKLLSFEEWFIARAIGHLLVLASFIFFTKCLPIPSSWKKGEAVPDIA